MATAIGTYATRAAVETRIGGTFTTAEDSLIDDLCNQVNMTIERQTGRILAPITSAVYLYDGDGTRRLSLAVTADGTPIGGIRAISLLEVQYYTNAGYLTVDSSQYFLRGKSNPAAPYDVLLFTDFPTGFVSVFPKGFATVRITATAGWAVMPDDVVAVAVATAVDAWHKRQVGEDGTTTWALGIAAKDRETLRQYTLAENLA